jgi:hypothetical protein
MVNGLPQVRKPLLRARTRVMLLLALAALSLCAFFYLFFTTPEWRGCPDPLEGGMCADHFKRGTPLLFKIAVYAGFPLSLMLVLRAGCVALKAPDDQLKPARLFWGQFIVMCIALGVGVLCGAGIALVTRQNGFEWMGLLVPAVIIAFCISIFIPLIWWDADWWDGASVSKYWLRVDNYLAVIFLAMGISGGVLHTGDRSPVYYQGALAAGVFFAAVWHWRNWRRRGKQAESQS